MSEDGRLIITRNGSSGPQITAARGQKGPLKIEIPKAKNTSIAIQPAKGKTITVEPVKRTATYQAQPPKGPIALPIQPNIPRAAPHPIPQNNNLVPPPSQAIHQPSPSIHQSPVLSHSTPQVHPQSIPYKPAPIIHIQIPSIQVPDTMNKFTLLSCISQVEDDPGFNNTDITKLGIHIELNSSGDLTYPDPINPDDLLCVFSDAPLGNKSWYPVPPSYCTLEKPKNLNNIIHSSQAFSEQTLLYIFNTQVQPETQQCVSEKLDKTFNAHFDQATGTWRTSPHSYWSTEEWKEIQIDQDSQTDE